MFDRNAFTLDLINSSGGDIEQQIYQEVLKKIHLIDIEKATICPRQQTRFESLDATRQGVLDVDGSANAIFSCAQRKIDHGHWRFLAAKLSSRIDSLPTRTAEIALI